MNLTKPFTAHLRTLEPRTRGSWLTRQRLRHPASRHPLLPVVLTTEIKAAERRQNGKTNAF